MVELIVTGIIQIYPGVITAAARVSTAGDFFHALPTGFVELKYIK